MEHLQTTATLTDKYTAPANAIAAATGRINNQLSGLARIPYEHILGGLGLASLGVAAMTAAKGIVGATVEAEKFNAQLTTLTGSKVLGEEMNKFAEEFTGNAPFVLKNVMEAMIRMKAFGLDPLDGSLRKVGDLAAGFGKDIMDAAAAVSGAMVGMWRPMREFGINRKMVQEYADRHNMASGFSGTGEIIDKAKVKLALFGLMQEKTKGGMAEMMKTIGGKWTVVREGFWQIAKFLGGDAVFGPMIKNFEGWILKTMGKVRTWFAEDFPRVVAAWAPIWAGLTSWVITFYNVFTAGFLKIINVTNRLTTALGGLKQMVRLVTTISAVFITVWVASRWEVIMSFLRRFRMGIMAIVWWLRTQLTLQMAISAIAQNWVGIAAAVAVGAGVWYATGKMMGEMKNKGGSDNAGSLLESVAGNKAKEQTDAIIKAQKDNAALAADIAKEGNENTGTIATNTSPLETVLKQIGGGDRTKRRTAFEAFRLATSAGVPGGNMYGTIPRSNPFQFQPYGNRQQVTINLQGGTTTLDRYIQNLVGQAVAQALGAVTGGAGSSRRGASVA